MNHSLESYNIPMLLDLDPNKTYIIRTKNTLKYHVKGKLDRQYNKFSTLIVDSFIPQVWNNNKKNQNFILQLRSITSPHWIELLNRLNYQKILLTEITQMFFLSEGSLNLKNDEISGTIILTVADKPPTRK